MPVFKVYSEDLMYTKGEYATPIYTKVEYATQFALLPEKEVKTKVIFALLPKYKFCANILVLYFHPKSETVIFTVVQVRFNS